MLTAAEVMTSDVITVGPDHPVRDVAELLYTRRISGVPVVDANGGVIGVVSEGDLIYHTALAGERRQTWWLGLFADENASARDYIKTHGRTARDVMSAKVVTVEDKATLADIAETMQRHGIKRIPVVRGGKLVGIVTRGDLLKGLVSLGAAPSTGIDDDGTIRKRLLEELRNQPWAHLIDVQVEDGVVHLHGTFQSEDERRALRIAAENLLGVKRVEDHLAPWSSAPARYSGQG
jgi:CBS domain-containing protein